MSRSRHPKCGNGRGCGTCWLARDGMRFEVKRAREALGEDAIPAGLADHEDDRYDESGASDNMTGCDCPDIPQVPCIHVGGPVAGDGWAVQA